MTGEPRGVSRVVAGFSSFDVILAQPHGDHAALAAPRVERCGGALDHAASGDEKEVLVFGELAHAEHIGDPFVYLKSELSQ